MAMNYSLIAVGSMILQSAVNVFGSSVVAAFTAATKVEQISTQTMATLGARCYLLQGQNLGQPENTSGSSRVCRSRSLSASASQVLLP